MAKYVDGFVIAIKKNKVPAYKKMALEGKRLWKKYGALNYKECIGNDLNPDTGGVKVLGFPNMIKLKKDETVWFSFIVYKNKKHRDEVNKKVMSDPSMQDPEMMKKMPFDFKRMASGGFEVVVDY